MLFTTVVWWGRLLLLALALPLKKVLHCYLWLDYMNIHYAGGKTKNLFVSKADGSFQMT